MENMILSIVTLLFVLILWHFLWKDYALDKLRSDLFKIRSKLFDIACDENEIDFNHNMYLTFEVILNNTIRYGYKLSFMRAVIFRFIIKTKYPHAVIKSKMEIEFNHIIHNLQDKELKNAIQKLKIEFDLKVIKYLLRTSLVFSIIFLVTLIFMMLKHFSLNASNVIIKNAKKDIILNYNKSLMKNIEYQAEALATS